MAVLDKMRDRWKDDPDFHLEQVLLELSEQVGYRMAELDVSQADLATMLGKKPSQISKFLSGENVTLKTVVQFAMALDLRLNVKLTDKEEYVELAALIESLSQCKARQKKKMSLYTANAPGAAKTSFGNFEAPDETKVTFYVEKLGIKKPLGLSA